MTGIPREASDFTTDWLNAALRESGVIGEHAVVGVEVLDSNIPGQTAEVAQLAVTYDSEDCPLPPRLIAKYTSRNRQVIESVINLYQQYWRETSFYNEIPDVGISRPECLYARYEPDSQEFVLLMNDLAPAISPSWASTPEQVAEAVSHLPRMHARWWNSPVLREKDWLVQFDNRDFFRLAAGAAVGCLDRVRELFGDDARETMALMQIWAEGIEGYLDHIATRPFTLVHGDYHPKQLFFPSASGGEFSVIDWQFSFVAQGAWDLARIILTGQDIETRREREPALIRQYHAALLEHGVENYSLEDLEHDYRLGIYANQMIMTIATGDTDIGLVEQECTALGLDFRDVVLLRGEAAVRDWEVGDFLKQI